MTSVPPVRARGLASAGPALLAALTFGVCVPFLRLVYDGVPALPAAGWLYLCAGAALTAVLRVRRALGAHVIGMRARHVPWILASAVTGSVLAPWALVAGLSETSGQAASLLLNLEVPLTAAVAVVAFGEHLPARRWVGAACIVAGGVACAVGTSAEGGGATLRGAALVALACLGWAVDSNLLRGLEDVDPLETARWKGLLGGALALCASAALGQWPRDPPLLAVAGGAAVGVVSNGLSVALYAASIRRTETARTAALFGTAPFVGVVASWAVLGERPTAYIAGAGGAMALGVALLVAERAGARPRERG